MGSVVEFYRVCPVPRLPDVIDQENRRRRNRAGKVHRGAGIALFKIVLGLMCPGGPSRRGSFTKRGEIGEFGEECAL